MVYVISEDDFYFKIGYAIDPRARLSNMQTGNTHCMEIRMLIDVSECSFDDALLENALHEYYRFGNIRGEWYTKKSFLDLQNKSVEEILMLVGPSYLTQADYVHIQVFESICAGNANPNNNSLNHSDSNLQIKALTLDINELSQRIYALESIASIVAHGVANIECAIVGDSSLGKSVAGELMEKTLVEYLGNWKTEYLPKELVLDDIKSLIGVSKEDFLAFVSRCNAVPYGRSSSFFIKKRLINGIKNGTLQTVIKEGKKTA